MVDLSYLPKLLLQYEGSPYMDTLDLKRASEKLPVLCSVHPSGCARSGS